MHKSTSLTADIRFILHFLRQRIANGFAQCLTGAVLILLAFSGLAEAQSSCTSTAPSANAVFIRAEGTTEQVGDLTFSCSGGGVSGTATISVYLSPSVSITSKVLNSTTGETEALAITSAGQSVRGIVSGSSVSFNSLPFPAGAFSVTITNIRVDASQLSNSGLPTGISETIFIGGTNIIPAVLGPVPTVAYVAPSLSQTSASNTMYPACSNLTPVSGPVFTVPFAENFPSAFKTQGGAGNNVLGSEFTANTETGFYENDSGTTNQANSGTRVRVVFTNVPSGVGLYVPITLTGTGQTATTPTARLTTTEAGVFFPYSATSGAGIPSSPQMAVLAVNSGAAEAVYEITSQDPNSYDSFEVPIYLNTSSATLIAAPTPITATVNMAPVGSTNIPNFAASNWLTFTATASSGCSFAITPVSLPAATQNASYSQQLTAGPGSGALTWSVSTGSLPTGVKLNSVSGLLSGTPTATGTFAFTAKVVDQGTNQAMQAFTLQVNPAPTAGAITCFNATSTPNLIRGEGLSEQVGDLTFTCSGGGGFATINVGLSPTLNVTSKVLASSSGATEAVAITSAGSVQGIVTGSEVLFSNVPLPSGTSTVTITNIRVNVAALTGSLSITIDELAFVSGAYVTPAFVSNGNVAVAYVLPGLAQTSAVSATYSACTTLTPASGAAFTVKFGEDFPSAFKTQGGSANSTLGSEFTSNTETGFFETISSISNLANFGTRIRVVFTNVPAGVGVYVPTTVTGTGQTSTVPMLRLTATEAGAFSPVAAATGSGLPASPALAQIVISGGTGEAVYEVTSQDPNSLESFAVPVYLSGTSAALSGSSSPITATVNLAPVGVSGIPVFAAADSLNINVTASATCIFTISPSSLPSATEGASYSQPLIAGPGKSALTWSISAGSLPAGLSLDPIAGLITGVPTAAGSFTFTAKAVDQTSDVGTQQFTLQVNAPIVSSGFTSTCTSNAGAVFLRAEGLTERVADTTLSCTGGGGTVTLQVFTSPQLPITSKALPASGATEALAVTSSGSVQGVINGSSVTFYGVQVPAGSSTVTITNIRVNASAINFSGGTPTAVAETTLLYGSGAVSTVLAPTVVGYITNGLAAPAISGVTNYSVNAPIINYANPSFILTAAEGFSGAFKTQMQETGTPIGNSNAANSGTRIRLLFQNVPANVGVLVPISVTASGGNVLTLTASETGPFSAVPSLPNAATGLGQAVATGTSAVAIYELTTSSTTVDSFSIPVYLNNPVGVSAISAPITATVSLGPLNAPSNIPEFILPASDRPLTGSGFITATLTAGIAGVSYGPVTVPVSGGVAPYTFSAASLPSGLTMSSAGVVTGTPASPTSGLFAGSVLITDSTGAAFTASLAIRILSALTISTSSLPATPLNVAYSQTVAAQGGTPSYTYSVQGALPPGLSYNATTGVISGTPTTPGTYPFTVTVTDSGTINATGLPAQVASEAFQIVVGLTISSTGPLYPAFINAPYSTTLVSSNGTGALTWTVSAGALPAGITLAPATGVLSGTPTVAGIYTFTIQVADSASPTPQTQTHQYSFTVAQQYVISTIAGGVPPVTPQPALNASIGTPNRPAVDSAGNVYFASFNSILKVDTSGNLTRVAGNGRPGYSGDGGPAISAQLWDPGQIAVDGAGNLYIADSGNLRVRKVSATTGIITTIAGGTPLDLVGLAGVAVDGSGNVYFTDTIHLNKLTPAGVRTNYFNANFIQFPVGPGAISSDSAGNIYFTDSAVVYKVSPAGVQTTVAGTAGTTGYSGDGGPATAAVLWLPQTPVIDSAGNLFIYDSDNGRIRKVSTNGTITTVIGPVSWPVLGTAMDGSGNFYGIPSLSTKVTRLSPGGVISDFAGNGTYEYSGIPGPSASAQFFPSRLALDATGNLYFSDFQNRFIGWVSPAGSIASVSVTGTLANSLPQGLAVSEEGNPAVDYVYYADDQKNQVMLCLPAGLGCEPFAGNGARGFPGDGSPAINAELSGPNDVAVDPAGNVYIADSGNNRIRMVNTHGVISTYAGNGTAGFSGDGGQATAAQLNVPSGLAVFGGNLYVADTGNRRVRMVSPTGQISTVAGGGTGTSPNGGLAVNEQLNAPGAISLDSQGNLYIVDQSNFIWRVTTDGILHAIAGTGSPAYSGDGGPAGSAAMAPTGIAVNGLGTVYLANDRYEYTGDAIRVLTPSTASPLNILTTTLPSTSSGAAGYSTALAASGGTGSYTWSVLPQALPPGLSLNAATGVITGTPGATGFYDFTVTVTDSGTVALTGTPAQTVSQNYRITVNSALALSAAALPVATTNVAYSTSLILATGGTPSYTYSIVSGSLPNGLVLTPSTGAISGAASVAGPYSFTVKVTDSGTTPQSATQTYQLIVQSPPTGGGGGGGGGGAPPAGNPLSVSPATLTFNVSAGTVASTQTIALSFPTFTQGAPAFSASFNTNQGSGWLSVSPGSGTMTQQSLNGLQYTYAATIMVSVNPANVPAGSSFTGTVNLSASGGIVSVPITMNVNSQPARFTAAPTALTFSSQAGSATLPATQSLAVFSTPTGASFTASASATSGGSWLSISPSSGGVAPAVFTVSANTAGLAAGSYLGQIAVTGGAGTPLDVPVSLTVAPAQPPKISVSPSNPTFTLTQGAGLTAGQIAVSNAGGGTLQFSAAASSSPSGWLQLAGSGSGSATSSSPASEGFTVNPAGLSPGAYSGLITFTDTASNTDQATVAVMLAVSQSSQSLSLSQNGLTFSGVQNGPAPPTQSFAVMSAGQGSLPWNATANMLSGTGWLSVTPSSGTATGQIGSPVTVTVNQVGLTPGQYYGSVGVSAQNAANSPQTVSVLLSVGASGTANTGPAVSTGALVFTGPAGGTATPSQQVNIFNPASSPDSYTVSAVTSDGAAWLSIGSTGGPLNSGSNRLSVSTTLTGIAAGVHTGTIALSFGSGGTATIQVVLIATASPGSAVSGLRPQATFASACSGGKPGYLIPVFAEPASQQSIQAGQANLLRVYLFDDCGNPVTASEGGVVQVDFGDGDAPVNLHDTGNGIWEGTWIPIDAAAQVTLNAVASEGSLPSIGATVSVTLLAASASGAGVPGGVVNAASQAVAVPGVVTPGSYITIYGSNLAGNGQGSASTIPLPFSLNGTQATIGNQPMPLLYAGLGQINALVPQSLNPNASYPLVIQNGPTQSVPVPLTLVSPQPAVYTANLSGSGQGVVEIAGTTLLAAPLSATSRPAIRGTDFLVIYCTGLGPVQGSSGGTPPADGAAAPSTEVFQTADNVTVTIGGISVNAAFAGLTPTLVGLYQINVRVPAGAASGGAVPLFVTVTDPQTGIAITSNTVTVALQ